MKVIDARGLACPAPVIHTKAAVEQEGVNAVKVIIDNQAAQQNVNRFLESKGFETSMGRDGDNFIVNGKCKSNEIPRISESEKEQTDLKKIMVMVATDRMGYGDDDLGLKLMVSFIKTLNEIGPELWRLVFVNNGVKLAIAGSAVLPVLKELERQGIHILVCGTCLTHFDLLDEKQVGETTNMLDIVTAMQLADKVVSI
jgi:selenium metabolism protein YedF